MDHASDPHLNLIERVAAGDEQSFGALYDCFSRPLFALGLRSLRDPGRAEELVQETMVKIWRAAGSFDSSKGRVSSWIFTVAHRTAIDLLRKKSRSPVPTEFTEDVSDTAAADAQEWRDWEIGVLLGSLPHDQRTAVEMFVIEGYTHSEVAEILQVPLGTIKGRIYTGLKHLRQRVQELEVLEASQ